ncbi:MAG: tetratricopeptide repeat protein, partial [Bacteroidota bacterium]|nr:tetratricopeptide repeat protein [Bacteroidota bacterium]
NYARKAIEIRPDWGEPYLLIGRIYIDARSSAFPDKFDQTTVIWAAIDQFTKAKAVDPKVRDKTEGLIKSYSVLLPPAETLFYYALKKGDDYLVKSWLNEKTTVKARD